MNRNAFTAAALAAFCVLQAGCSDDKPSFKGNPDGATGSGGSDSGATGSGGAAGSGGGAAGASAAGATSAGGAGDGSTSSGKCGGVSGRTAACNSCLDSKCCDFGTACAAVPDCPKLAECSRACDSKTGAAGDTCRSDCLTQYPGARREYNDLVLCMGQFCLTECPFHGP